MKATMRNWKIVAFSMVLMGLLSVLAVHAVMLCVVCVEVRIPNELGGGSCYSCLAGTGDSMYCFDGERCGSGCVDVGVGSCTP